MLPGHREATRNEYKFLNSDKVSQDFAPHLASTSGQASHQFTHSQRHGFNGSYEGEAFKERNGSICYGYNSNVYNSVLLFNDRYNELSLSEDNDISVLQHDALESSSSYRVSNSETDCTEKYAGNEAIINDGSDNDDVNDNSSESDDNSSPATHREDRSDEEMKHEENGDDEPSHKNQNSNLRGSLLVEHEKYPDKFETVSDACYHKTVLDLTRSFVSVESLSEPDNRKQETFLNGGNECICDGDTLLASHSINCPSASNFIYHTGVTDNRHSPFQREITRQDSAVHDHKRYLEDSQILSSGELGASEFYEDPLNIVSYHPQQCHNHLDYHISDDRQPCVKDSILFPPHSITKAPSVADMNSGHGFCSINGSQIPPPSANSSYHQESPLRLHQHQAHSRPYAQDLTTAGANGGNRIGFMETVLDLQHFDKTQSHCGSGRAQVYPWMKKTQNGKGE